MSKSRLLFSTIATTMLLVPGVNAQTPDMSAGDGTGKMTKEQSDALREKMLKGMEAERQRIEAKIKEENTNPPMPENPFPSKSSMPSATKLVMPPPKPEKPLPNAADLLPEIVTPFGDVINLPQNNQSHAPQSDHPKEGKSDSDGSVHGATPQNSQPHAPQSEHPKDGDSDSDSDWSIRSIFR